MVTLLFIAFALYVVSGIIYWEQLIGELIQSPPFGIYEYLMSVVFILGCFTPVFNTIVATMIILKRK